MAKLLSDNFIYDINYLYYNFMKILQSASKIVFLFMALATFILVIMGRIDGKDFFTLSSMAFAFYFANKGEANKPYAGK